MIALDIIREATRIARERRRAARLTRELFNIARTFNHRHAYADPMVHRWMCPTCNKVHDSIGYEGFCGLIYPACCGFHDGHRITYDLHATTDRLTL